MKGDNNQDGYDPSTETDDEILRMLEECDRGELVDSGVITEAATRALRRVNEITAAMAKMLGPLMTIEAPKRGPRGPYKRGQAVPDAPGGGGKVDDTVDAPKTKKCASVYDKVLAHLRQHPGERYNADAVAEFLGEKKPNVAEALNRSVRNGVVERPEPGVFVFPVTKPSDAPTE
jgi:hypothetical protein